jgi:hypothetical protein
MQSSDFNANFTGVKVGDVNNTAVSNSLTAADDRNNGTLLLDVADRQVAAGETVEVTFKTAQDVAAYQLTLNVNGLTPVGVVADDKVTANNFGFFNDAVTVSIDGASTFTLKFQAEKAGNLSEMLSVSNRITKAEAYAAAAAEKVQKLDVALRFNGVNGSFVAGAGYELMQNVPNPVNGFTNIAFNLPTAAAATITISNAEGRVLKTIQGDFAKGLNTVAVQRAELSAGVLFYQLKSGDFSATKKMIVVE